MCPGFVRLGNQWLPVMNPSVGIRILDQHAEHIIKIDRFGFRQCFNPQFDPQWCGTPFQNSERLGMTTRGNKEGPAVGSTEVSTHDHGFSRSGSLVKQ